MNARVDLHTHTTVSDGTLTPTQLVELAAAQRLAAIAITDHDHTGALLEAREAAAPLGIEIVTGIELSVMHAHGEFHLLGYCFDADDPALLARLEAMRTERLTRARRMLERIAAHGIVLREEDVLAEASEGGAVGRPHVARVLVREGHVSSIKDAFDQWLADGRPGYVGRERLEGPEAIALIHAAGGVAVMAHPVTVPEAHREPLIRQLAAAGLDGIEIDHPQQEHGVRTKLSSLARELRILTTGGSDFHGENKPDIQLGSGRDENVRIEHAVLDAIKMRASARKASE